jgi:uncharacterized integral membrane protein
MAQQQGSVQRSSTVSRQWIPRLVAFIVLLILLLVFVAQNSERVDVSFFFWDFHMRLVWALLGAAVVGVLLGWMVPRLWPRRRR